LAQLIFIEAGDAYDGMQTWELKHNIPIIDVLTQSSMPANLWRYCLIQHMKLITLAERSPVDEVLLLVKF